MYVIELRVGCTSHGCRMFHVRRAFDTIYPGLCWQLAAAAAVGCNLPWPHLWAARED